MNGSGICMTFTLYSILANREAYEITLSELRSTFKSADDITGHSTEAERLPFLTAVIKESKFVLILLY